MVRKQQLIKVFSQKLSIRNVVAQLHQFAIYSRNINVLEILRPK